MNNIRISENRCLENFSKIELHFKIKIRFVYEDVKFNNSGFFELFEFYVK